MHRTSIRSWSLLPKEPNLKRHVQLATLVAIAMTAFIPSESADLFVGDKDSSGNCVFRYNEMTGDFIDVFILPGSGGLSSPRGLLLGPDGNLFVNSFDNNSGMRYDGANRAPLASPGQGGAVFVA